jgi:hypothetical protein
MPYSLNEAFFVSVREELRRMVTAKGNKKARVTGSQPGFFF